jgi:hypothetical protein
VVSHEEGAVRQIAESATNGEVLVVQNEDATITVFGALKDLAGSVSVDARTVAAVLSAFAKKGVTPADLGQRVFAMREEDLAWFDAARKMQAGNGYVHGTLQDEQGRITRNIAIKEVSAAKAAAPPIDAMALVVAAQLASIQAQLTRIENRLEDVVFKVQRGVDLIERDQAAEASAAITVTGEVYGVLRRANFVGPVDWSRVANAEQPILKRQIATVKELEAMSLAFQLDGTLGNDKRSCRSLDVERWKDLLTQETMLRRAALQWTAVYAARKQVEGLHDLEALQEIHARHSDLAQRADAAVRSVLETAKSAPRTKQRHWLEQLFSNGLLVGGAADASIINTIEDVRSSIKTIGKRAPSIAIAPPEKPPLRLIA